MGSIVAFSSARRASDQEGSSIKMILLPSGHLVDAVNERITYTLEGSSARKRDQNIYVLHGR